MSERQFHIQCTAEDIGKYVFLPGDPGRTEWIASYLEHPVKTAQNREFTTWTGTLDGTKVSVTSTGIGGPSAAIAMEELAALGAHTFLRIGTCGGLQPECPEGTFVASQKSIGFDGLINFYARRNEICDLETEAEFKRQVKWIDQIGNPYCVDNNKELLEQIAADDMVRGITIACGGFYGPQGRELRAPLADPELNAKIEAFEYKGLRVNNFEMESSALAGLSLLLGHKALTCCMVIANRRAKRANTGYKSTIDNLIKVVLDRI